MRAFAMVFAVALLSCLATGAQAAQVRGNPRAIRPPASTVGTPSPPLSPAATPVLPAVVTIKHFGLAGPVTGGQNSLGLLVLDKPASGSGVTIQLSSDNGVVTVPATITVAAGTADQSFQVTTGPVTAPTVVTVSAEVLGVTAAQTATVTVVPPSLAGVSCTPTSVPGGSPVKCTVRLNGPLAAPSLGAAGDKRVAQMTGSVTGLELLVLRIALSTSNADVATVPAFVPVGPGQRSATFDVTTLALPQSASATISAAYGGLTKSTTLAVQPVSLLSVKCTSGCELGSVSGQAPGAPLGMIVTLTAPAPSGFGVMLSSSPNLLTFWTHPTEAGALPHEVGTINVLTERIDIPLHVSPGQKSALFDIRPRAAVAVSTTVMVSGSYPPTEETRTVLIKLKSPPKPHIKSLSFLTSVGTYPWSIYGVPLGGRQLPMEVRLDVTAPDGGFPVDLTCSGATDIECPDRIVIAEGNYAQSFDIIVHPCALNPPCQVSVSTGDKSIPLRVYP